MASTISLRVYQILLSKRGKSVRSSFNVSDGGISVPAFVSKFITQCSITNEDADLERSWSFEQKVEEGPGNSKGYIQYGTFGFESNLIDKKTKRSNYRRKTTDSEVVPLFYEFWYPPKEQYMFVVFQSFQGRSCVHIVMDKMRELFEATNQDFILRFKKLIPNDSDGSIYKNYPVQKLTLIKRNVSNDIASRYTGARPKEPVHLEISLVAKRKGTLGNFSIITDGFRQNQNGVITHDGIAFDEATANVRVGQRTRAVGIFGGNSEAGVIDLTDTVERGTNGHPKFDSISKESNEILKDFQSMLKAKHED